MTDQLTPMRGDKKDILDRDGYVFMIGAPGTPHSMIWRLWADRKSNVYLAPREQGSRQPLKMKTSFHVPTERWPRGARNEGMTSEFFCQVNAGQAPALRHIRRWEGDAPLGEGLHHAYRLWFPRAHLRATPLPPTQLRRVWWLDVPWPDPETRQQSIMVDLVFQGAGRDIPTEARMNGAVSGIVETWRLSDGRAVILAYHIVDCPLFEQLRPTAKIIFDSIYQAQASGVELPKDMRVTLWTEQEGTVRGVTELAWDGLRELLP